MLLFLTGYHVCDEKLDVSWRNFLPFYNAVLLLYIQTCKYRSKAKTISFTCLRNIYHVDHGRNSHFVMFFLENPLHLFAQTTMSLFKHTTKYKYIEASDWVQAVKYIVIGSIGHVIVSKYCRHQWYFNNRREKLLWFLWFGASGRKYWWNQM